MSTIEQTAVDWVVNDLGELGVCVNGRYFFLYKGESLEYGTDPLMTRDGMSLHDDGTPMLVRLVGKREFGETCWPLKWVTEGRMPAGRYKTELTYIPGLSFGQPSDADWRPLPAPAPNAKDGA